MAFDIEKMKTDGVSAHLIELASMTQETFLLLIARRLEHDKLYQQFMATEVSDIEAMYPYAVAAGLMSESDREWLVDEGNPYKSQSGEVWFTGTLGECKDGIAEFILSETDKAKLAELIASPSNYSVSVNDTEMKLITSDENGVLYNDTGSVENYSIAIQLALTVSGGSIKCPTDITTVEVTVAHK